MVTISPAEKDAFTDGAIVFLGTLGVGSVGSAIDTHLAVAYNVPVALVAGVIAALNTYRQDSGLPPVKVP